MRPHGSQEQLERRRRRAVELLNKGLEPPGVAARVGCSLSSVYLWKELVCKQGEASLRAKPVPGRPSKLNQGQKKRLTKVLLEGALKYGYSTDLWTQRRVSEVIGREFGIQYHPNHMWRFLTDLGWSCQKPERRARERDEAGIQHWKRYQWPHIKKRRKTGGASGFPR